VCHCDDANMVWSRNFSRSDSRALKVTYALGGRANAMFEGLRLAGERGQIQDSQGVNFSILNAPYRLLSGREVPDKSPWFSFRTGFVVCRYDERDHGLGLEFLEGVNEVMKRSQARGHLRSSFCLGVVRRRCSSIRGWQARAIKYLLPSFLRSAQNRRTPKFRVRYNVFTPFGRFKSDCTSVKPKQEILKSVIPKG
jgi:hypothetical protein